MIRNKSDAAKPQLLTRKKLTFLPGRPRIVFFAASHA